ncbi:MAG TPA: hypothetical protein VJ810_40570 [Blastocatellia bacterium]|nr:hypothetical protein [Blastocatellia bacterium]
MTRRIITGYLILTLSVIWFFFSKDTLQTQDQLSRENFFREILYAKATKNTHLFDDYTKGSYHVNKIDVYQGLPTIARKEGVKLHGLIVIGPVDVLWAYYVLAFVEEKEKIRVSHLTMPHARITYKSTGVIDINDYREMMSDLKKTRVLKKELPAKGKCETCEYPEWHYEVLVVEWSGKKTEALYGKIKDPAPDANADLFLETLNRIFSRLDQTYPVEGMK